GESPRVGGTLQERSIEPQHLQRAILGTAQERHSHLVAADSLYELAGPKGEAAGICRPLEQIAVNLKDEALIDVAGQNARTGHHRAATGGADRYRDGILPCARERMTSRYGKDVVR